ncbi:MAG: IclR family transcriptional regulator [Acetobacteraceae bacterium]
MAGDDTLKSLGKLMRVLDCFSLRDRALPLAEIARRTGLPKSTAHRLAASLRAAGLLDQDAEGERYRLGLKLYALGSTVLANMELHREARPFVDALARLSGQTVHLAVFDGHHAVVVQHADAGAEGGLPGGFIETAPAHSTGVGKALLAFQPAAAVSRVIEAGLPRFTQATLTDPAALRAALAEIRARGFATDTEEHRPGLACVAAPIRDHAGRVVAAISASGPVWRFPAERREAMVAAVRHSAAEISAALGWREASGAAAGELA